MLFLINKRFTMNLINQKIWKYVQSQKDILKYLFKYDFDTQDMSEYMLNKNDSSNFTQYQANTLINATWLYRSIFRETPIIGIINSLTDDIVVGITNDAGVGDICELFDSFPYEVLRDSLQYEDNQNTANYFLNYPDFHQALLKYEAWAKENNIQLDKYNIYHNENGELFKEYFER